MRANLSARVLLATFTLLVPALAPAATPAIRQMATLYESWGKPRQAEQWKAKLPPSGSPTVTLGTQPSPALDDRGPVNEEADSDQREADALPPLGGGADGG
jgi:hypothetical protein